MNYIVTEIQVFDNGAASTLSTAFEDLTLALAKYYQVLAAAAVSTLPVHSCAIYSVEGEHLKSECFKHEPK